MKSKIQGIVGGIALAVALACVGQAQAADNAILTTSAQLGNMSIRLVDLDPNDGVGPSATFNMYGALQFIGSDGAVMSDGYTRYDGSLLPSTLLQSSVSNQSAQASPSGWKVTSVITSQDLSSQIDPTAQGTQSISFAPPTPNVAANTLDWNASPDATITLGANTAMIFSGTASTNGTFNRAKLAELLGTMAPNGGTLNANINASLIPNITLALITNEGDQIVWNRPVDFSDFWMTDFQVTDNVLPTDLAEQTFENQQEFSVEYTNLGTVEKKIGLNMVIGADTAISGQVSLQSASVPGIPEPSTHALMALGLVGIGLASRKCGQG